jgi:sugar diacid utilization regulator
VVEEGGNLAQEAERTLASAAPIAALHLLRARHADDLARQQRTELASGILAGDLPALPTLRRLGMDSSGPFVVLAFTPREVPEQDAHRLLGLLALQLDARLGRTATCVLGGIAYVIAAGTRVGDGRRLTSLARDVVTTARASLRIDLLAAVGRVVDRADEVPASQGDTGRVLALLLDDPDCDPVGSVASLATTLVLDQVSEWLEADPLTPMTPGARLVRGSSSHAHAVMLRSWLAHGRDIGATARELGVHPNTVRYRLRRAAEALGIDYDDSDQVLLLWLMLRNASRWPATTD